MVDTDRITGAARELGGKAQGAAGDLTGSRSDAAEGRLREAQGTVVNLYGQAKDAVREAAGTARETIRDYADEAADVAEDAYARGRQAVREGHDRSAEWPHVSLVVAGLVGFGLGLLVSARRD